MGHDTAEGVRSLFDQVWADYIDFNPQAKRVYDLLLSHEQKTKPSIKALVNDHVAYRTFDLSPISLSEMARLFEKHGYRRCECYVFLDKKLNAYHYESELDPSLPKVFISELETARFSPRLKSIVEQCAKAVPARAVETDSFLWSRRPWEARYDVYRELLLESEYAAWVYAFGFRANHFTIAVNSLVSFADLEAVNAYVKSHGYRLNSAGGEIKGVPSDLLEQSSTLAETARVTFQEGTFEIPACYYEFARRYLKADGQLYSGFLAANADKIFESTNVKPAVKPAVDSAKRTT